MRLCPQTNHKAIIEINQGPKVSGVFVKTNGSSINCKIWGQKMQAWQTELVTYWSNLFSNSSVIM